MSEHCGFNIFEDCNCGGECKSATIPLDRFTKANDMRGVFTPDLRIILATIALFAVSTAIVITIAQLREDARAYEISQRT